MKRKYIVFVFSGLFLAVLGIYGLMVVRSNALVKKSLSEMGYADAITEGLSVYADGIVIKKLKLTTDKVLSDVYIQANPLQQILLQPKFISIGLVDFSIKQLPSYKVGFVTEIPFTVDKVVFHSHFLHDPMDFVVEVKQNTSTQAAFYFTGKNKKAHIKGRGEIYFGDHQIQNINFDFSKIDFDYDVFKTKRADGWASLVYKDKWQISGEVGAGYANINNLELQDAVLNINGAVDRPIWNLNGMDKNTNQSVAISQADKSISVSIKNQQLNHEVASYFDLEYFAKTAENIRDITAPPLVVVTKTLNENKNKPTQSLMIPVQKAKEKDVDALQIIEAVKKPFEELVSNSFFEGFYYTNGLTVIEIPCVESYHSKCWIARARTGALGYDTAIIPAYFTRMKDYSASSDLRRILQSVNVKTLTVYGSNAHAQQLIVNGMSSTGQPVYIELSVSDVN